MTMPTSAASLAPFAAITSALPLGGSTTFLLNLARVLQESGLRLPVIALSEVHELHAEFAAAGAEVHLIPTSSRIYEDRLAEACRKLAEWQPRGVLACLGSPSFEILRLAPPGTARVGIIQSHDPGPYALAKQYGPWIDAMVGVSEEICTTLRAAPEFQDSQVAYIPYGIQFSSLANRLPRPEQAPLRVAYLGRLVEEQKRVSRFVPLMKLLRERGVAVDFTLAGTGPDEAALRAAFQGVEGVHFKGALRNQDVPDFFAAQDVFILLSDFEGLPLALLEAMGAGTVPVVPDLESGMREAVPEACGIRVPVGDVDAAAAAIMRLAENPEELERMSESALAHARSMFTAQRMAADFTALFQRLSGTKPAAWAKSPQIPVPLGVKPGWLFREPVRSLRRWRKSLAGATRR